MSEICKAARRVRELDDIFEVAYETTGMQSIEHELWDEYETCLDSLYAMCLSMCELCG